MQSKDLINKLYRLIETNNTTWKTPQSTPSQSKTPPAEEKHFITINDSINKSITPSLNRSLPATPIVEPNTTLRVLSIGNSSLNARLEAPETKLKSDSHVKENFCLLKIFPNLVKKILSFVGLVCKIENKWILKLQNLFSSKTGWFKNKLY